MQKPSTDQPPRRLVLRPQAIETLAAHSNDPAAHVHHAHSLGPVRVALPPMPSGEAILRSMTLREFPEQGAAFWDQYISYAPPLFVLRDVLVHGSAGIIAAGNAVIADSLAGTSTVRDHYERLAKDIAITPGKITALHGTHVSLLAGNAGNYAAAMLDCLARIAVVPENYLVEIGAALLPENLGVPGDSWRLLNLPPSIVPRIVRAGETLHLDTLVLPLSITGDCAPHPQIRQFFDRLSANVAGTPGGTQRIGRKPPKRLLILRGRTAHRPLLNEAELLAALTPFGFVPVRFEGMSLADQIRLCRDAEMIVAPHGAALANLGFCRPGTKVLELQMDAYVNWRYRHLAAICGLNYDCLPGRAVHPWPEFGPTMQQLPWLISPLHAAAAVERALASGEGARGRYWGRGYLRA
jgi:hypothetical protein